jgi:phosphotransferase system  glucose/maltose/N-acetylglucosamine-specific IIC component
MTIRRYTLWGALGSAAVLLIISILDVWNVISTTKESLFSDYMSGPFGEPNAWGQLQSTAGVILALCSLTLLLFLIAHRVIDDKAEKAPAKKK